MRAICWALSLALSTCAAIPAAAATEKVLYSFDSYATGFPDGNLLRTNSGVLVGTASGYGVRKAPFGQVFMLKPKDHSWTFSALVKFNGQDGATPFRGVIGRGNSVFYGTTMAGGAYGKGTVFQLTKSGQAWTESVLYDFQSAAAHPEGRLLLNKQALDGTTAGGDGTAFEIVKSGNQSQDILLHKFGGSDGKEPLAGLISDPKTGTLYGTTATGGASSCGNVFTLRKSGDRWIETVLYSFSCGKDGGDPQSGLVEDSSGALYGTTYSGGDLTCGYRNSGCGTVFKLSKSGDTWSETVLHAFGNHDGQFPEDHDGLAIDASGALYGTATQGGQYNTGIVFRLAQSGGNWTETVLHSFGSAQQDGEYPQGGLIEDPKTGTLYGTTFSGGAYGYGTIYEIAP